MDTNCYCALDGEYRDRLDEVIETCNNDGEYHYRKSDGTLTTELCPEDWGHYGRSYVNQTGGC